ncbi:MAG: glycosyltransferase [Armatimonadota bacterium]|nr:glycosyltransferase [Armatimonadota bacterium]
MNLESGGPASGNGFVVCDRDASTDRRDPAAAYHVLHLITDLDVGGAELTLARVARRLQERCVRNTVVSLISPGPVADRLRAAGIPVRSLEMRRGAVAPGAVLRLREVLRRERPDVVQTWLHHADLLGTLAVWTSARASARPALVWNVRASTVSRLHDKWLSAATRRACAWLSRHPAAIVANSQAGVAVHRRFGYRAARWVVIPNGVDLWEFRPDPEARAAVRRELGVPEGAPLVGLVARLHPQKGHGVFLAASAAMLAQVPALHVLLAGAGVGPTCEPFLSWLHTLPDGARARVRLVGCRHDVRRIHATLDLACSASLFGEGFPNAVAEAMACGVPVVATDVGDTARIVADAGLVVPPGDAALLAAGCLELLKDDDRRRRLGAGARRRIEQAFPLDRMPAAYDALYRELLQSRAVRPPALDPR